MPYYVLDEKNNKIEVTSLEVITEDTAFRKIKNIVDGSTYSIAFCTQAQYNEMEAAHTLQPNTLYNITDDTTMQEIENYLADLPATVKTNEQSIIGLKTGTSLSDAAMRSKTTELSYADFSSGYIGSLTDYVNLDTNKTYEIMAIDNTNTDRLINFGVVTFRTDNNNFTHTIQSVGTALIYAADIYIYVLYCNRGTSTTTYSVDLWRRSMSTSNLTRLTDCTIFYREIK